SSSRGRGTDTRPTTALEPTQTATIDSSMTAQPPDMEGGLSSGRGEVVSTTVVVDTTSLAGWRGGDERVGVDASSV
ncbi:MAG: hypothetical protein ACRDSF_25600, partial [Pseudonocardiaceae bacterium]